MINKYLKSLPIKCVENNEWVSKEAVQLGMQLMNIFIID